MSSSLQLNQINIPQLNQCGSEKERYRSPPPRPPVPPTSSTEDIDNANRIGKRRKNNNMCSHHRHHGRGEHFSNDFECRSSTATKDTVCVYTRQPPLSRSRKIDEGGSGINSNCKGICCAVESVQCAPALGDTHHDGGGTLKIADSNFKCVSTLSGRVTCAVLPQPRPLEYVHKRCRDTAVAKEEEAEAEAVAAAASSIQEPSETDTQNQTREETVDRHINIGKHLSQANKTLFSTNTSIVSTTTTRTATTTSWASTSSSLSSPTSVQDFAKCLTAEEKSSPPERPENSLAKSPLSAKSCDFVLSELYFGSFGDIICYNLSSSPAICLNSLQGLLNDSLSHFHLSQRIFLVANQSFHSQWLSSKAAGVSRVTPCLSVFTPNSVQNFNYYIFSACNLSSVLLFVNNELVSNLNENLYFLSTTSPTSTISTSSTPSSSSSSSSLSSSVDLENNICKSSKAAEKQPQDDEDDKSKFKYNRKEKASDEPRRRQTSQHLLCDEAISITTTTITKSPPTSHHALEANRRPKASHSLLKVSDVQKNIDNNKRTSNNGNNDNERQCNGIDRNETTVSDENSSHLVEDDAFRASQRLKRLEENFKDLTTVRKVTKRQPRLTDNVHITNAFENRLAKLTRSFKPQPTILLSSNEQKKEEKNTRTSKSCNCGSYSLSPSKPVKGASKSSTTPSNQQSDIFGNNESSLQQTPIVTNCLSDKNNNLNLTPSDSLCHPKNNNNFNENKVFNESNISALIVNNNNPSISKFSVESHLKKDIFYIPRPVPSISEFDVRQLSDLHFCCNNNNKYCSEILKFECYDELLYEDDENGYTTDSPESPLAVNVDDDDVFDNENEINDDECDNNENVCECTCQKCYLKKTKNSDLAPLANSIFYNFHYPIAGSANEFTTTTTTNSDRLTTVDLDTAMRELNGQLRGLLKQPNRPPPTRKNRVVFDETRNEFFEADYIILIREDCAYDEEDEEPCTCGEHELVRLCCEEGCQCNYTNEDTRTPQSPKFAPPIEFVDEAALSPPDGYKDNGLKNSLGGALSGHIFGAQHIQQLQVIQRLQQQRAAMLAARNNNPTQPALPTAAGAVTGQQPSGPAPNAAPTPHTTPAAAVQPQPPPQSQLQPHSPDDDSQPVCTECAECVECAAKQLQDSECTSPQCQDEVAQLNVPTVALVPLHSSSPERRITQKEIIAGEERPKYVLQAQYKPTPDEKDKIISVHKNQRFVVETITMTTVTERRIVREATEDITTTPVTPVTLQTAATSGPSITTASAPPGVSTPLVGSVNELTDLIPEQKPPIPPKESSPTQISGILKGGKLWKQESINQSDEVTTSSEEDTNAKRSVRFVTEDALTTSRDGDGQAAPESPEHDSQINELIPIKKHSTLFTNALRPNSAVRQLFPSAVHQTSSMLTHEALRAFDESKRAGNLLPNLIGGNPGDSDTVRRSIERNILRRSLIKKKAVKSNISLEERIKQLTCDIDESNEDPGQDSHDENGKINILNGEPSDHRDSPTGEENPQQKYSNDKSFSPSSSVSSSSSGSSSAYKKISDIFNRDKKQEKIIEMEENPIVIIPQECRCPAAPDLGMGIQVPVVHTQIHRTPPRQTEPKRQFLSTLAPLTACVAGQKDDLSYYTLAAAEGNSPASTHFAQYNMGDMEPVLCNDEMRKVAPDVIAGTPGQEQDELAAFAQQEANRTEKLKKRYTNDTSNASSDDDEQNDYGFNKRPSVRGIKPKFSSTNEILQQMQDQLTKAMPSIKQNNTSVKSYTLPKQASSSSINKQLQNVQPQNQQVPAATAISQQQTERTWSFYGDPEQQRIPMDENMPPGYYHTLPTVFQQSFPVQEETLMYQNCVTMEQHYGRYARSPTRRPESPPPLRNYHQTMVLIPYNAETYSQFAATGVDPKVAQIQRQNILEYQQVTQQTIRVPISYALPAMQLHVVAGRGHTTQQYVQHQQQQHIQPQQQSQRILAPRYSIPQDGTIGFSERGVPEGAAAVSHTDCKGIVSPTTQANQPQQQQQMPNCNQTTVTSAGPPGSVFYAMNV